MFARYRTEALLELDRLSFTHIKKNKSPFKKGRKISILFSFCISNKK